ncbi:hypothetical protein QJQ58_08850 [Paenibacillus dendritiformis]|uniref:hypothetical protein n=1 Tax=Paenibacillus dendritiformis TaxID=130049 RepID=UPI000DA8BBD1|nr:hypothetical protein [Paenibacillus dendritiformis]PZM66114.1 hypothetical protein DOE73_08490 [Paenibacillus dendritiformis]WGU96327.1 hypothetical protein QJQ58_08850 [Paenibacillus dendritiformis]
MGLDYQFVVVIKEHNRAALWKYVEEQGEHLDTYIIAHFPMDSFILKYLEGGYSYAPHYDAEEIQQHILADGRARIGGIDIAERKLEHTENEVAISFTAVTSDMSLLFQDSISIHRWFIGLSQAADAVMTYLDLEYEGERLIYYRGDEINIELKGEGHLDVGKQKFLEIIEAYANRTVHFEGQ